MNAPCAKPSSAACGGSWAVKSGDLMQKFVNDELKNMTVLNERLSLASSMGTDKRTELEALADAILESMK